MVFPPRSLQQDRHFLDRAPGQPRTDVLSTVTTGLNGAMSLRAVARSAFHAWCFGLHIALHSSAMVVVVKERAAGLALGSAAYLDFTLSAAEACHRSA